MNTSFSQFIPTKIKIIYKALTSGLNLSSAEAEANLPPGTIKQWTDIAKREIRIIQTDCQLDPKLDYEQELNNVPVIVFYLKYRSLEAQLLKKMKGVIIRKAFDGSAKDAKWWIERYEMTEEKELNIESKKVRIQHNRLEFLRLLKDIAPEEFKKLTEDANINTATVAEILSDLNKTSLALEDKRER
ncbi:MAG: hypothetical protein MJK13_14095 [Pseudomonadales bacterium]|nr:hypothetical protein [Pseudomonadales bacterium]